MSKKEWTLMFYFASDNPLAPSIVSQLKAIKQAGFHPEANIIARFDPHQDNTPAHIFDVNRVSKLKYPGKSQVGFDGFSPNDPFVQNLVLDKLWGDEKIKTLIQESLNNGRGRGGANGGANIVFNPPMPTEKMSGEQSPADALESFLDFCIDNYEAHRYMLFILGHGVVVGNDLFLLDEHVNDDEDDVDVNALSSEPPKPKRRRKNFLLLKDLAEILGKIKEKEGIKLEMVGFHSCSMSSLEVAYELQGCANYMLASQGPAFVGSWPYKQILIRIYNDLVDAERGTKIDVEDTVKNIFYYCLYNSYDFQLAGYSFDLALCDLNKVSEVKTPISELAETLSKGLPDPLVKELVLLSHWESQSFWQESYTDLYDFCLCLSDKCKKALPRSDKSVTLLEAITEKCGDVIEALRKEGAEAEDKLVISADFAGPLYQYSHGLSVFFPWSRPVTRRFRKEYHDYEFSKATGWHKFLDTYFKETMRLTHTEDAVAKDVRARGARSLSIDKQLLEEIAATIVSEDSQLSKGGASDATGGKGGSSDPTGSDCDCPSIKNYPPRTRPRPSSNKEKTDMEPFISTTFFAGMD